MLLATRLYNMTDDPGMRDILSYLIARDTMHQNQWLAVLEENGGMAAHPIPNSFPQNQENEAVSNRPRLGAGPKGRRSLAVAPSVSVANRAHPAPMAAAAGMGSSLAKGNGSGKVTRRRKA
jgi:Mn-containing catalase